MTLIFIVFEAVPHALATFNIKSPLLGLAIAAKFNCKVDCPGIETPFCSQLMVLALFAKFETEAFN